MVEAGEWESRDNVKILEIGSRMCKEVLGDESPWLDANLDVESIDPRAVCEDGGQHACCARIMQCDWLKDRLWTNFYGRWRRSREELLNALQTVSFVVDDATPEQGIPQSYGVPSFTNERHLKKVEKTIMGVIENLVSCVEKKYETQDFIW